MASQSSMPKNHLYRDKNVAVKVVFGFWGPPFPNFFERRQREGNFADLFFRDEIFIGAGKFHPRTKVFIGGRVPQ